MQIKNKTKQKKQWNVPFPMGLVHFYFPSSFSKTSILGNSYFNVSDILCPTYIVKCMEQDTEYIDIMYPFIANNIIVLVLWLYSDSGVH